MLSWAHNASCSHSEPTSNFLVQYSKVVKMFLSLEVDALEFSDNFHVEEVFSEIIVQNDEGNKAILWLMVEI